MSDSLFSDSFRPEPFFVITAKDEDGNMKFLRRVSSVHDETWHRCICKDTYRYPEKKQAQEMMDIQVREFSHENGTLACYKVKKVKFVAVFV